ncbi:MAG: Uma2 family endonuclease [Thiotrichales bacterium]
MPTVTAQAIEDRPITAEELYAMRDLPGVELVRGQLQNMAPTGFEHGIREARIGRALGQFCEQHGHGEVMTGEVGIYIHRDPDSVRAADALFISHERLRQVQSASYLDVAPELVVEVLSPGDSWVAMADKLEDYFSIGVTQVWFANPGNKTLQVFHSVTHSDLLREGDTLANVPFLPGFELEIGAIYA